MLLQEYQRETAHAARGKMPAWIDFRTPNSSLLQRSLTEASSKKSQLLLLGLDQQAS